MVKKLLNKGFNPYNGLNYLADAIELKRNNINLKTCQIYQLIADKYNITPSRVERCIRHCIKTSNTDFKNKNNGYVINALVILLEG